jgi:succinoglycan biosynthesis transport protein ExoP
MPRTQFDATSPRGLLSILWRTRWPALTVIVAAAGAAVSFSFHQTPVYESTATVLVKASPDQTQRGPRMATEKLVATSSEVAEKVAKDLRLPMSPGELLRGLTVEVPVETEILRFTYTSPGPHIAQQRAGAFARAYLSFRRDTAVADAAASQRSLDERINALEGRLNTLGAEAGARSEASVLAAELGALQRERNELALASNFVAGQVLSDAPLPHRPVRPDPLVNGLAGGIVGLLLAVAVALMSERFEIVRRGPSRDQDAAAATSGAARSGGVEPSRPTAIAAGFFDRS